MSESNEDANSDSGTAEPSGGQQSARRFPASPGVYLFKDAAGLVIYVGKATNLRSRAGSYFLKAAAEEPRTALGSAKSATRITSSATAKSTRCWSKSRLIKDIQPKHNKELKDDKTFPYLMITTHEDFPRVEVTREPRDRGVKLYGPFTSAGCACVAPCRCCSGSSSSARAVWISPKATSVEVVSPLPAGQHQPMHGAVQSADQQGGLPARHPPIADVPGREEDRAAAADA